MRITNAQRADLIDALQVAIEDRQANIDSFLPPVRKHFVQADKDNYVEWSGQVKRCGALRRRLLAEEKAS